MTQTLYIIDRIEEKNDFIGLCFLEDELYEELNAEQKWLPLKRLLVDSEHKHLIYIMDVGDEWVHIRFPAHLWKQLDNVLVKEQDLMLVLSKTDAGDVHTTVPLKDLPKEGMELIGNMRQNANYGEDMVALVEESFPGTLQKLG